MVSLSASEDVVSAKIGEFEIMLELSATFNGNTLVNFYRWSISTASRHPHVAVVKKDPDEEAASAAGAPLHHLAPVFWPSPKLL
ncbi:hypothetical protein [Bradyrhizobium ottawaense]|uniref:hypothetical protein n=1 Tax=Bradyrhizobium ottawaense TaxID=931866 RepID=UPI00384B7886